MTIPFPQYAKIKDRYCIAYFGNCNEYLIQLRLLRPIMEHNFPGLQIYIACKEEAKYLLQDEPRVVSRDELKSNPHEFAYIRELTCNMQDHPVEEFMKESGLRCGPVPLPWRNEPGCCVIYPNGVLPTRSLDQEWLQKITDRVKAEKYEFRINGPMDDAEWVIGVENEQLFLAAATGRKVTLISTGLGENIFKSMFPNGDIWKM